MTNNFDDDMELNEELSALDELEENETNLLPEILYVEVRKSKSIKLIPLAFTVEDNLAPVTVEGLTLAWTNVALGTLAKIKKAASSQGNSTSKNLPYASLRGLLEVGLNNAARIQSNLGLSSSDLQYKSEKDPDPFAYLTSENGENIEDIRRALRPILNDWITNYLKPFAESSEVSSEIIDELEDLHERGELLKITLLPSQVLPWKWSEKTGTTQARKDYDYRVLVDYVARLIAGQEIFQGLGAMKRVISSGGNLRTGISELITNPIKLPKHKGLFSLVLRLEVITYPSLHQPLLKIDVSKRRWLRELKSPRFKLGNISGFVFAEDYSDSPLETLRERAFSYTVLCQKEKQGENKNWHWIIDKDFEALRRKLHLPMKTLNGQNIDGQAIAVGRASTKDCQVMLTYRNGLQESKHGIEAGVPEIDKLEAFEASAKILEPIGFKPFDNYLRPKFQRGESHKLDDTASRMINLPTLLGAVLESLEKGDGFDLTPNYLESFKDDELNSLLNNNFDIRLDNIWGSRKALEFGNSKSLNQVNELKVLIQANQEAMGRLYPNERPLLVILYEEKLQIEVKLLQAIIRALWGGAVELMANRLPENTHGQREILPDANLSAKERSHRRIEAWEPIVKQLALRKQRTFCLVMAREWYPENRPDDRVNKPSTRQALAKIAGSCVQFLLPIQTNKEKKILKIDDFFHRLQAALKDLTSAHSGRIDRIKEKVDQWLPQENKPKEIIGITIVRKQKGRVRGRIENTFLPVAMRLKVDTGECELCCAYEQGNNLQISPWTKFPDAIAFISQISPVKLADKQEVRQTRFMEFVNQVISNSVADGNNPLVMIDSSNCVQLWPWLADARMNADQINLGQQYERMQEEWKGARLIRIRQDLAPGIIDKKVRELAETSLQDTRTKKELTSTYEIPSASSAMGLFRLSVTNQTGCVAYLSVRNNKPGKSRGQSCYRSTEINIPVKKPDDSKPDDSKQKVKNQAGLEVYQLGTRPPFVGQYPTPNPLEIVVTLRQPNDDPDRLAALVESLRYSFGHYSDWTTLPAPLFFERVVRDYISEFAIEEEMAEAESELEENGED
ncbi:MAG TPA: hypothetical protein DCY88_02760 [Cyanobacteria bacterium UBA11372]|nr:hypothetical protein [Cyanobacteria bacterium UBA11372]